MRVTIFGRYGQSDRNLEIPELESDNLTITTKHLLIVIWFTLSDLESLKVGKTSEKKCSESNMGEVLRDKLRCKITRTEDGFFIRIVNTFRYRRTIWSGDVSFDALFPRKGDE